MRKSISWEKLLTNGRRFATKLASGFFFRVFRRGPRGQESFAELFSLFREVLDRNNHALEIITDMGDTLSGDYLFDIQYVRSSYADLSAAMTGSMRSFDALTHNSYPRLWNAFQRIDVRIRRVIEETNQPAKDFVVFLEDAVDMAHEIGGKSQNLAELKKSLKLDVPAAFAITTRAYDMFMVNNRIFDRVGLPEDRSALSSEVLAELRRLILSGELSPEIVHPLENAIARIKAQCTGKCFLAIRSSAVGEDEDFSFAGQFETILNISPEPEAIAEAYKQVIASLFSDKAFVYQKRFGYDPRDMKMAVCCMAMVDSEASGVMYSTEPGGDRQILLINAVRGLGTAVVEGGTDADLFTVRRDGDLEVIEAKVGMKTRMVVPLVSGGTQESETPENEKHRLSLNTAQVLELARLGLRIEKYFRRPQDIEWALDRTGRFAILQSRPLRLAIESQSQGREAENTFELPAANVLMKNRGIVVQQGAAMGRVYMVRNEKDLDGVPEGAIIVAHRDSSHFVRVMTNTAAIITDIGTPTSHMAALCREFRIPTVVNTGKATELLSHGQEITIAAESDGATLYEGLLKRLVKRVENSSSRLEDLFEFRKKRYLLRYIAPLNLVDPLRDEFTPSACRSIHDILRFIHEKSVTALLEFAEYGIKGGAVHLDLPIPARIMIIDVGGGLQNSEGRDHVTADRIESLPLRSIISGMTYPGLWRQDPVPLKFGDFISGMLSATGSHFDNSIEPNMAVISRDYVNINLRFGYHFMVMDCFISENARNNHIYFRFAGGATNLTKRSRRIELIATILGEQGFNTRTKGDLIIARLANIGREEAEAVLNQLGRLMAYTRQLDAMLNDDDTVKRYAMSFLNGRYEK